MIVGLRRRLSWANTLLAMSTMVSARRLGFRLAYRGLQVWWFLRRPDTEGVKCLLLHEENVLLVRHTYGRRCWDMPGGGVRRREAPADTARREMREELGITGAEFVEAGTIHGRHSFRRDTVHLFHARLPSPDVTPNLAELATVRWFARQQLPPDLGPYVRVVIPTQ
jgi:8-oxo-dGTP pyrophosphatase MutT (NUDIX family)